MVTRYAPSPTGYLHLGHAAHLLYVWGLADLLGAEILLRVEDHDRQRSRPEYEAALLQDLDWLGLEPKNRLGAARSDFRQSNCSAAYKHALRRLEDTQEVYRCVCSRRDLAKASLGVDSERIYSGRCRRVQHPAEAPHGLRLAWTEDAAPESFVDGFLGPQSQQPERQCGDLLLQDRLGQWSYQFAATVDDHRQGVNLVVRGADLLASTGRQIRLARMLGRKDPPHFFHHPLVTDSGGVKLSKKQQSPALRELRRAGLSAATVLGEAARAAGLTRKALRLARADIAELVLVRHRLSLESAGGLS